MTALFGLDLHGKRVVVAGAGALATRRIRRFLGQGADVLVVAPAASDEVARHASHGDLEWRARPVEDGDLEGAWFVLAATDDDVVNESVAAWATERRIWCIEGSDATKGTARQAAASIHGDLVVGVVSTGSPDPARVRAVRDAVAKHIDTGGADLRRRRPGRGRVILVGSGPGDPSLMTVRGRQALSEADVVVADRLGATELLATLPYDVEVINVGKSPTNHPVPQAKINEILVERASRGLTVVRLKGGDPYVFGRGGEEVNACLAAGVNVDVVPGVTSALSVPALAGIPVTQRGITGSVLITSGHAGADPAARSAMAAGATVVILMGVSALGEIAQAGLEAGAPGDTPVAIVERGSTRQQRITRGTLASIDRISKETGVKPPAVIVVGQVAADGLLESQEAATPTD